MKYLLTSAGIKNTSIHNALLDLLGKPIAESSALCIPTAIYPCPGGPAMAYRFISGATVGLVDFALLPHLDHEHHPESSTAKVASRAAKVPVPLDALDDETAIKVTDGTVEVVSEGHWKLFPP
jgi:hypothetical protein